MRNDNTVDVLRSFLQGTLDSLGKVRESLKDTHPDLKYLLISQGELGTIIDIVSHAKGRQLEVHEEQIELFSSYALNVLQFVGKVKRELTVENMKEGVCGQ